MNYPLISEYIEAIKSAEDNFDELSYLRPVLDDDGEPVMSAGGFSIVFKMKDEREGKYYAVKCFTKEQQGRAESYKLIADELEFVSSNYLTPIKYLEKELYVDTTQTEDTEFPVLLMDWVEGKTLEKYIKDNAEEKYLLEMLTFQFCKLATWLLSQSFAHGDLKPDNILVKKDGSIVLVDYDGMFVPSMKGQRARELGSPGFRHPLRSEDKFDEHVDDFSIALIAMALKAFSIKPELLSEYCNNDTMFFTEKDFAHIYSTKAMTILLELVDNEELCSLFGAFMVVVAKGNLSLVSPLLYTLKNPKTEANYGRYIYNQARSLCEEAKDKSKIDYNKAFKLFQKAAKLGNSDAQCCMGCCFKNGYGTSVDYEMARTWYDKSSKNGCSRALRHIGFSYLDGIGVKKDTNMAIEWLKKAIDLGDVSSMVTIGAIYYYGKGGMTINYEEAVKWYTMAAERGDDDGMWRLALCYERGNGLEKNFEKAFEWFKKSAEKENPNGLLGLGKSYYEEMNYKEAVTLYKKAIEGGNVGALYSLGHCYEYGYGVEKKDLNAAYTLYKKAANLGHKKAIEKLNGLDNDQLPFPVVPETKISPIPYPESKESVKRKIRKQFLSVEKAPYYSYFSIINTLICNNSNSCCRIIRPIWIPSEIENHMNVDMVVNGKNVECTYSQNGNAASFIQECNTMSIEDVVELSYELFYRLGLIGYFISNGAEAINKMNEMKALNDRSDDLPF